MSVSFSLISMQKTKVMLLLCVLDNRLQGTSIPNEVAIITWHYLALWAYKFPIPKHVNFEFEFFLNKAQHSEKYLICKKKAIAKQTFCFLFLITGTGVMEILDE